MSVAPGTVVALVLLLGGCSGRGLENVAEPRTLEPYPNPFGPEHSQYAEQPTRQKPLEVVVNDGIAYVSLQGTPDEPGHHVVAVDLASGEILRRIEVGAGPTGLALHPSGELLLVLNRYSNFASVIDTARNRVVHQPAVDFYATEAVFTPDGAKVFLTNRWRNRVVVWDVVPERKGLSIVRSAAISVASNPRDIAVSPDGRTVAVAALSGLSVSLIDVATHGERYRLELGAPPNGLVFVGDYLVVPTLSGSTHHQPLAGPDTDGDGVPGDGTPNVNFQDLQNELAVFRVSTGEELWRYTSDTLCCKDYRDVNPTDLARYGDLLPPEDRWIVGGALPEQIAAADDGSLYVTYSASNEIQRFWLDPETGALEPGEVWPTAGHAPHGIVVAGDRLVVTHRLSETLGVYDRHTGALERVIVVGDTSGGTFPSTDAEIGELFNYVTAPFSVDGDQSCAHCHREDGNIDKAFSMPLTRYGGVGLRMTMSYRGAADTRPWFFESAMDESNFRPVINEFARIENFCCSDYTLWPNGAPADCTENPPAECTVEPNASSLDGFDPFRRPAGDPLSVPRPTTAPSRGRFFKERAKAMFGRERSFGDGLFFEDPITGERQAVALDLGGMTRALGLFLLTRPRLLPNPTESTASSRRGQAIFEDGGTGCSVCHPAPSFAVSTDVNPLDVPIRMGPVVTPNRDAAGRNLDLYATGFSRSFPQAEMDSCEEVCDEAVCSADASACDEWRNVYLGVPSLRGIWDRAPSMLHDGRARGLREVLATPGHAGLRPGETGFNERDGVPDTHGGTSHLTPEQLEDLIAYLLTL